MNLDIFCVEANHLNYYNSLLDHVVQDIFAMPSVFILLM